MDVVLDASVLLAVLMEEPEKARLIALTQSAEAIAPNSLPFEIANALSGMVRRKWVSRSVAVQIWQIWRTMPVQLRAVDIKLVVELAGNLQIYAYDAFFLQCALETGAPLLTLDKRMKAEAKKLGIQTLE
jgi:predicted nucleic acid-binding protein